MGKKKELTTLERKAIRSWGGWRLANLLITPLAKPSDGGEGGHSHPKGWPADGTYWLGYKRNGIRIERRRAPQKKDHYASTTPEIIVLVKWQQVFDLGAGMTPELRERIKKVCAQHRKHQSQGFRFQRPRLTDNSPEARQEFERLTEEFNQKVYYPWLDAGKMLTERIDSLLDEAVGSLDGLEAELMLANVQALLAKVPA